MSDLEEIVREYLEKNNLDGLCFPGECACLKDNLFPCGNPNESCAAGKRVECVKDEYGECVLGFDDYCEWHIEEEAKA